MLKKIIGLIFVFVTLFAPKQSDLATENQNYKKTTHVTADELLTSSEKYRSENISVKQN